MIKEQDLPKRAYKRFTYDVQATCDVNKTKQPVQIHNISKSGIQFYSNVAISRDQPIRLTWQDAKFGTLESSLLIVREIPQITPSGFAYCYGSKFVNLKDEVRRNLNRLVETTQEHEIIAHQKLLDQISYRTINDLIAKGRMYLRDLINGKSSLLMIEQFAKELKDYEKQSFRSMDDESQWLQKLVTQYFHCRILISIVASPKQKLTDFQKIISDKLQSIDCLVEECQKAMGIKTIAHDRPGGIHETLNRVLYARVELAEVYMRKAGLTTGQRHL